MNGFQYYTPTKVVFGKDTEHQAGALVREFGGTKVLVHYGKGSVKRSGLLDRVFQSLDDAEIPWMELGGAVPNPHLSLVHEGIDLCRREGVDFILAVGGGSAIDRRRPSAMASDTMARSGISMRKRRWQRNPCRWGLF